MEAIVVPEAVREWYRDIGKRGGAGRARKLSARRRSEIARLAARARWAKKKLLDRQGEAD